MTILAVTVGETGGSPADVASMAVNSLPGQTGASFGGQPVGD